MRYATWSRSAWAAVPTGAVHLLAHLRTFGWLFNPLTVYYCWSADGAALDALVLEVTNTPWGERHWYVIDARTIPAPKSHPRPCTCRRSFRRTSTIRCRGPRRVTRCTWTSASSREGETMFMAGLALRRRVLDRRHALLGILLRYPALPMRVSVSDLPPSLGADLRPRARIPSSVATCAGDPPHDPAKPNGTCDRDQPAEPSCGAGRSSSSTRSATRTSANETTVRRAHRFGVRVDVHDPRVYERVLARRQRRPRRVLRRRLVGHRRPHGRVATRAPQPARQSAERRDALHRLATRPLRPDRAIAARRHRPRRAQRPRALRPRQRLLPAHARRDDDVLVRDLRRAGMRSPTRPGRSSTGWHARSTCAPAIGSSRSAPAGAASRCMPPNATGAASRPRPSRPPVRVRDRAGTRRRARAPRSRVLDRRLPRPAGHLRQGRSRSR